MTTRDDVRLARAYLLRVAEPPAVALGAFVGAHGPLDAAAMVRAGDVPGDVRKETTARYQADHAAEDCAAAARVGARLVIPEDDDWPGWPLLPLDNAVTRGLRWAGGPLGLWVRGEGHLGDSLRRTVAIIGARASTSYGEHVAAEFGHELASTGVTVVSGAAYGIDGAAHRGALAAGGPTVAVLGCGVDVDYPAGHAGLLTRIAERGFVLSEYPPGTPPARHRFLVRNRLIASVAEGTIVVEAGMRSGARNTAATAAALGRVVMAVPGPVTSAMSLGCHELLRGGLATVVGSIGHVIEAVGPFGVDPDDSDVSSSESRRPTDGLDAESLRVHEALATVGRSATRIAVDAGVPIERVRAVLPALELAGLATRGESGWQRAKAGTSWRRG